MFELNLVTVIFTVRYKNLAYVYTEVRAVNDVNNNAIKTAEFLLTHEWVMHSKCTLGCAMIEMLYLIIKLSVITSLTN